jgi:K+-transporting ATPase c subunit
MLECRVTISQNYTKTRFFVSEEMNSVENKRRPLERLAGSNEAAAKHKPQPDVQNEEKKVRNEEKNVPNRPTDSK